MYSITFGFEFHVFHNVWFWVPCIPERLVLSSMYSITFSFEFHVFYNVWFLLKGLLLTTWAVYSVTHRGCDLIKVCFLLYNFLAIVGFANFFLFLYQNNINIDKIASMFYANLWILYFKSLRSSFQSHNLWVSLYLSNYSKISLYHFLLHPFFIYPVLPFHATVF